MKVEKKDNMADVYETGFKQGYLGRWESESFYDAPQKETFVQ
ncbi:hypothetical protein [Candidatus Fukatsuia symbiotica]|nr:hypothetical protein [Candidatus Fukatsuia symbiotica]